MALTPDSFRRCPRLLGTLLIVHALVALAIIGWLLM